MGPEGSYVCGDYSSMSEIVESLGCRAKNNATLCVSLEKNQQICPFARIP